MMRGPILFAWALSTSSVAWAGDPKTECIAAADQAQQARDDGKWRAARDGFVSCSRPVCPKMVSASCTKWAREVEEGMPTVVLSAKDASGNDVSDARVTFDGAPLASTLDGKPVEVDPGAHKFRFARDGSEAVEQTAVIKAGEKLRPISVVLRASALPVVVTATPPPVVEEKPHGPGDGAHVATTIVFGVLAAGAFAGGIGLGFASQGDADTATALRSQMPTNACVGAGGSSASCQSLSNAVDAQNRDAALSVAMYVGAGVFAVVAAVAWFVWPKPKTETARVFIGPGSFGVGGVF